MIYQTETEIISAIQRINEEIYEKYRKRGDENEAPTFSITMDGWFTSIDLSIPNLPQFHIWFSDEDDRIFYEKSNKYENFYVFIKRKFREIKKTINKIKI